MSNWLMVRSDADLEAALRQVNDLYSFRQRGDGTAGNELQGVWIDSAMASLPPTHLSTLSDSGQKIRFDVTESTGLAGIWLLCRMEATDPALGDGRCETLAALIDSCARANPQAANQVIPVFSTAVRDWEVQDEMRRLAAIAAKNEVHLLTPCFQDPSTGRYIAPERETNH